MGENNGSNNGINLHNTHKPHSTEGTYLSKISIAQNEICPKERQVKRKFAKKRRTDKSDLGDDFVAPDGGWGWLVSIASGVSMLVTFALAQQFGIIFRDHMIQLGISSSQLTTIINIQIALSALSGLLNGPLFRRFTFRQVALFGSCLTFTGLFACVFANSFLLYCLSFSCFYGIGRGLTVSASSLAVNTYFKERRRTATAFQFGVAGLGPICLPYVATFFLTYFGVKGTVLLYSGLSLNTLACSLIYQPVRWHVRRQPRDIEELKKLTTMNDDDSVMTQPVKMVKPTLLRANDNWVGLKASLNLASVGNRLGSWQKDPQMAEYKQENNMKGESSIKGEEYEDEEHKDCKDKQDKKEKGKEKEKKEEKEKEDEKEKEKGKEKEKEKEEEEEEEEGTGKSKEKEKWGEEVQEKEGEKLLLGKENDKHQILPWYMEIILFFDLDLLRDFTYVNLAMGLTLTNFAEINFAILTPFILSDFGFENHEIALAMSLMGTFDLLIRFLIPLITVRINLSNKCFFVLGILGMCSGRVLLSFTRNLYFMIGIFVWLGLNKALRTVFFSLIIPGYVPLKRLPAAGGLQLLMSGLFSLACGPLIGLIRDNTNYAFAMNFLNLLCLLAVAGWGLEALVRKHRNKSIPMKADLK